MIVKARDFMAKNIELQEVAINEAIENASTSPSPMIGLDFILYGEMMDLLERAGWGIEDVTDEKGNVIGHTIYPRDLFDEEEEEEAPPIKKRKKWGK